MPIPISEGKTDLNLKISCKSKDKLSEISRFYGITQAEALGRLIEQEYKSSFNGETRERTSLDDIYDFFNNIPNDYCNRSEIKSVSEYRNETGTELVFKVNDEMITDVKEISEGVYKADDCETEMDGYQLVGYILQKFCDEIPLLFMSYEPNNNSIFTDAARLFLFSLSLAIRLTEIRGVEAKILEPCKSNTIYVKFENGSALKYETPTHQHPNGICTFLDADKNHKVEDNPQFPIVCRILEIPLTLRNKKYS